MRLRRRRWILGVLALPGALLALFCLEGMRVRRSFWAAREAAVWGDVDDLRSTCAPRVRMGSKIVENTRSYWEESIRQGRPSPDDLLRERKKTHLQPFWDIGDPLGFYLGVSNDGLGGTILRYERRGLRWVLEAAEGFG